MESQRRTGFSTSRTTHRLPGAFPSSVEDTERPGVRGVAEIVREAFDAVVQAGAWVGAVGGRAEVDVLRGLDASRVGRIDTGGRAIVDGAGTAAGVVGAKRAVHDAGVLGSASGEVDTLNDTRVDIGAAAIETDEGEVGAGGREPVVELSVGHRATSLEFGLHHM